jgi:excisionase family DNA binding protein
MSELNDDGFFPTPAGEGENTFTTEPTSPRTILTVSEAATYLRVSENTIRSAIKSGALRALRLGSGKKSGTYRIVEADFIEFLNRSKENALTEQIKGTTLPRPACFRHVDVSRWLAAQNGQGGRLLSERSARSSKPIDDQEASTWT